MEIDFEPGKENGRKAYRLDVEVHDEVSLSIGGKAFEVSNISINGIAFCVPDACADHVNLIDAQLVLGKGSALTFALTLILARQSDGICCCSFALEEEDEIKLSGYLLGCQKARIKNCT